MNFIETLWSYKKCQNIGVGKGLGRVRIKNFLAQTIPNKIFGTKRSNPVKLDKKLISKNWSWKGTGPNKGQKVSCSDCLKVFFILSSLPIMVQIFQKVLIWVKNVTSIKQLPIIKVESFLKLNF